MTSKSISYRIVIPRDPEATGECILENIDKETKDGGFCGETLYIWLVAEWDEESSYMKDIDWDSEAYSCEIIENVFEDRSDHVTTISTINHIPPKDSVVMEYSAAVPILVKLPMKPTSSSILTVWNTVLLVKRPITVRLPIFVLQSFKFERDYLHISLDYSTSTEPIDRKELYLIPTNQLSLSQSQDLFCLTPMADGSYKLQFSSVKSLYHFKSVKLGLRVIWGNERMISTFSVDLPIPHYSIGISWDIPALHLLQEAHIRFTVYNVSQRTLSFSVDMEESGIIPLEKSIQVKDLNPGEERTVECSVVPYAKGLHELKYTLSNGKHTYASCFKTVYSIDE